MHIRGRRAVFENQERYRHLIPQDFLNFTVNSVTLLLIGLVDSLVEKFIDLRIVVVTLVGKLGRHFARVKNRTHPPIRLYRRIRPANVIKTIRRLRRHLVRLYQRHALPCLKNTGFRLDANLCELLLDELDHLAGGGVVVARPKLRREAVGEPRLSQETLGFLRIIFRHAEVNRRRNWERQNPRSRPSIA